MESSLISFRHMTHSEYFADMNHVQLVVVVPFSDSPVFRSASTTD